MVQNTRHQMSIEGHFLKDMNASLGGRVLPGRLWIAIEELKQERSDFYWIDLERSFRFSTENVLDRSEETVWKLFRSYFLWSSQEIKIERRVSNNIKAVSQDRVNGEGT